MLISFAEMHMQNNWMFTADFSIYALWVKIILFFPQSDELLLTGVKNFGKKIELMCSFLLLVW